MVAGHAPRRDWTAASGHLLDEFTFRFNRRKSKSRGKLFYRLAQQAVQVGPVPFATLVKPQPVVYGGVK